MPSYDIGTDAGRVRLLINDVGGTGGAQWIFEDDEIDSFLAMAGSVDAAAARALRTLASNEALVSKRITFLELRTDGPAVAKALMELADKLDPDPDDEADVEFALWNTGLPFNRLPTGPELAE